MRLLRLKYLKATPGACAPACTPPSLVSDVDSGPGLGKTAPYALQKPLEQSHAAQLLMRLVAPCVGIPDEAAKQPVT
jgi:hypothetical protein